MPKRKSSRRRKAVDQGFVKSLAHELRVEILDILTERMASPNELAKLLDEDLSQVSYHVSVLRNYERIELVKTEPVRGAVEHYYRATSKTLLPAKTWRGVKEGLRAVIGGGLASDLFNDLADTLAAKKLQESDSQICRMPLVLDAEGWKSLMAKVERFTEEVEAEQHASAVRAAKANGNAAGAKGYTVGVLAFEDSRNLSDQPPHLKAAQSSSARGKGVTAKGKTNARGSKRKAKAGVK
ncbi:MAG TPA: helix-turn-helix domain-containing protein [Solirubrobacterales bacterium]|jgi:DNA-binding transcriptional ArsR family regulator|nr:helix-turn-helix domain-containing protein [Solirubrobacterales bacterium]